MKKPRSINYVPHNKFVHIDTSNGEDWDSYMENLSLTVSKACDKFFEKRGIFFNLSWNPPNTFKPEEKK